MEALITVGCATKTSRKSRISPEEPTALGQHCQISLLGKAPGVPPKMHLRELCCAEPEAPQQLHSHCCHVNQAQGAAVPKAGEMSVSTTQSRELGDWKTGVTRWCWWNLQKHGQKKRITPINPLNYISYVLYIFLCYLTHNVAHEWSVKLADKGGSFLELLQLYVWWLYVSRVTSEESSYCCLYI